MHAQKERAVDSVEYYHRQLTMLSRLVMDSLVNSQEYKHNRDRFFLLQSMRDSYSAMVVYSEIYVSDYKKLNADLQAQGFEPLNEIGVGFGYGFSFKKERRLIDFNMIRFGISNKSEKDDKKFSSNFTSFFELNFGYDLARSRTFNVYPYAGVSIRSSNIIYKSGKLSVNPNFTDLTNIFQPASSYSASAYSTKIGYQTGLGIEIVLSDKNKNGGVIFFSKAGISGPIGKEEFKVEDDIIYNADIRHGKFIGTSGFKFFMRK